MSRRKSSLQADHFCLPHLGAALSQSHAYLNEGESNAKGFDASLLQFSPSQEEKGHQDEM
jgi:hypothetical protein